MEAKFVVEETVGAAKGVGGGNLIVLAQTETEALAATEAAVAAMRNVDGVILPFPGGIVRSGSRVRSRYHALIASTNERLCPTLRAQVPETDVPEGIGGVYEIVIDGVTEDAVREAMSRGLVAAAERGATRITAGDYGGSLGPYHLHLHDLLSISATR